MEERNEHDTSRYDGSLDSECHIVSTFLSPLLKKCQQRTIWECWVWRYLTSWKYLWNVSILLVYTDWGKDLPYRESSEKTG
jgi:hypothetical protein